MIPMKISRLTMISALVPYVSVLIGLYVFKNAWIAIGLYHLGMIVFLLTDRQKISLKRICSGWNLTAAVFGIAMSVMIFPILYIFWRYMSLGNISLGLALGNLGLQGASWFLFMIYFSTVQPVLEELYWRGYLGCNDLLISWEDLAFAGYHILVLARFIKWPWLIIAFVILTMAASVWRHISSRCGGLIIPLLSHITADISIIIAIYKLIQ